MENLNTTGSAGDPDSTLSLGAWIGRGQAFSFVANHCSAAQAECLARVRNEGLYKSLDLTWEEFCEQHTGASRSHADRVIRRLEEFGAAYFRLSEIIRISPHSYRAIQDTVKGETLEFDGESIPLTSEHAPRIRRAVSALRADLRKAQEQGKKSRLDICSLRKRFDSWLEDMSELSRYPFNRGEHAGLVGLAGYSFDKIKKLIKELPAD